MDFFAPHCLCLGLCKDVVKSFFCSDFFIKRVHWKGAVYKQFYYLLPTRNYYSSIVEPNQAMRSDAHKEAFWRKSARRNEESARFAEAQARLIYVSKECTHASWLHKLFLHIASNAHEKRKEVLVFQTITLRECTQECEKEMPSHQRLSNENINTASKLH